MYSDFGSKTISYHYIKEETFTADIWHGLHVIHARGAMCYSPSKVVISDTQLGIFESRDPMPEKGTSKFLTRRYIKYCFSD